MTAFAIDQGRFPRARAFCRLTRPMMQQMIAKSQDGTAGGTVPTVLIVDDDPAVCNSLKFMLQIEGFRVRTYRSGSELLERELMADNACLVIDQILPGMQGLDVVAAIR